MRALGAATLLALLPAIAPAQSGGAAAYQALLLTPAGAFAPLPNASFAHGSAGDGLGIRVAHGDFGGGFTAVGIHGDRRLLRGRIAATLAIGDCDACGGSDPMLGVEGDWQVRRAGSPVGTNVAISVRPSIGLAGPGDEIALSAAVGVPFSILIRIQPRMVLMFVPGIGIGQLDGASGLRATLGGGLSLLTTRRIGIHAGAQHVFAGRADTQFGIALTLHRP